MPVDRDRLRVSVTATYHLLRSHRNSARDVLQATAGLMDDLAELGEELGVDLKAQPEEAQPNGYRTNHRQPRHVG